MKTSKKTLVAEFKEDGFLTVRSTARNFTRVKGEIAACPLTGKRATKKDEEAVHCQTVKQSKSNAIKLQVNAVEFKYMENILEISTVKSPAGPKGMVIWTGQKLKIIAGTNTGLTHENFTDVERSLIRYCPF
jgi:hypothetical protein